MKIYRSNRIIELGVGPLRFTWHREPQPFEVGRVTGYMSPWAFRIGRLDIWRYVGF